MQWIEESEDEVVWRLSAPLLEQITHNPFKLMAYLTAAHHDFTYPEIRDVIDDIFLEQYYLSFYQFMEIRIRVEQEDEICVDDDGEEYICEYDEYDNYIEIEVEYEWHILHINLTTINQEEVILSRLDEEQLEHFEAISHFFGHRHFVGTPFNFHWLSYVSSHYGYRLNPFTRQRQMHNGVDIALPQGTEILSAHNGVVVTSSYSLSYGNWIVIEEQRGADTIQTLYAHLHERFVFVNDLVREGEIIGTVGTTGASTGNHLHFEVIRNDRRFNPIFFAHIPIRLESDED